MKKDKRVSDYIEWRSISYKEFRPWFIVLALILLLACVYLVSKYGFFSGDKGDGTEAPPKQSLEKKTAHFTYLDGDVRCKSTNVVDWRPADAKADLYPGDMVQTGFNSTCRISFFDGTVYEVKPSSLIYIQESYEDTATSKRFVKVELSAGALDLSTTEKRSTLSQSKLETRNTVTDVESNTIARASYDANTTGTRFRVTQGRAVITAKETNEAVAANSDEEVSVTGNAFQKKVLPLPPELVRPFNAEIFITETPEKTKIPLQWEAGNPRYSYRVTVSSHPRFDPKVYESTAVGKGGVTVSSLPFGTYYWRVSSVNEERTEGNPSSVFLFSIRSSADMKPRPVRIDVKEIVIFGNILEVIGETEVDNRVYINGKKVELNPDGSFKFFTQPFEGVPVAELTILVKDFMGAEKTITKSIRLN